MRKMYCVLLVVILSLSMVGCSSIQHEQGASVSLHMVRDGIAVTEAVTDEEAEVILNILNGKISNKSFLTTRWSCPFGLDLAISIDETVYVIAQDDCGVIWQEGSTYCYRISAEEKETLEQIFLAHGSEHRE